MRPKTIDHKAIRAENRKKILQLLFKGRELTFQEMSRELDISIPTVTRIVEQLQEEGFVRDGGVSESVAGRRPRVIQCVPDAYYSIGVECSINFVRIVLADLDAAITDDLKINTPDYQNLDELMQVIRQEVGLMLDKHDIPSQKVLGIGFSLPGLVDDETRFLKIAPNLGLKQVDFAQYEIEFDMPVFLENEANAAAMAELRLGITKEMRNLVYLSILPKGIGTGIIVGGQLYRGKNKRAGEYGHTNLVPNGRPCQCGRSGCWERYASGHALLQEYEGCTGNSLHDVTEFFERLDASENGALEALDAYLNYLAMGIQDIILAQDPHYVIIGGILSPFKEQVYEELQRRIFVENTFYDRQDVSIRWTTLGENASILGVALLPFEHIFSSPVNVPD